MVVGATVVVVAPVVVVGAAVFTVVVAPVVGVVVAWAESVACDGDVDAAGVAAVVSAPPHETAVITNASAKTVFLITTSRCPMPNASEHSVDAGAVSVCWLRLRIFARYARIFARSVVGWGWRRV